MELSLKQIPEDIGQTITTDNVQPCLIAAVPQSPRQPVAEPEYWPTPDEQKQDRATHQLILTPGSEYWLG